jgi:hypothetical protein
MAMKALIVAAIFSLMAMQGDARAQDKGKKEDSAHVTGAAGDHRAMADAHLNAAKCLESSKPEKDCHAQLAKDCKGLGIGKYCGLKHRH